MAQERTATMGRCKGAVNLARPQTQSLAQELTSFNSAVGMLATKALREISIVDFGGVFTDENPVRLRSTTILACVVILVNALGIAYFFAEPALLRAEAHAQFDRFGTREAVEPVVQHKLSELAVIRLAGLVF